MTDEKAPVNEPSALWRAYTNLVQQGTLYGEAVAATLGLDATALRCVGFAWNEPDLTPGRLAELTGLTSGAVTGVLDRLERAGFIDRIADPTDRRRTLIRVSHARGRELGAAYEPLKRATEQVLAPLEERERTWLATALTQLGDVVAADTARLHAQTRGGMVGSMFRAPMRDVTHGRLTFRSGAPRLALRTTLGPENEVRAVAELTHTVLRIDGRTDPGELILASFSGPLPDVRTHRDEVSIAYKRRLDWRQREARIGLLADVPWTIDVSGGLSTLDADLRSVRLRELAVSGSVDDVRLQLGRPDGTSRIAVSGSSRDVVVELPAGVALRLALSGGAKDIRFEREHLRNTHGTVRLETRGAQTAADRFELDLSGGAGSVKVRRP